MALSCLPSTGDGRRAATVTEVPRSRERKKNPAAAGFPSLPIFRLVRLESIENLVRPEPLKSLQRAIEVPEVVCGDAADLVN